MLARQRLAGRDPQLPSDEVEPGDRLGHRMLDLQPRVHFEKIELFGGVEQELDGSGAAVADRTRGGDRGFGDLAPQLGGDRRRRRLLDHLLVPALDRAIAFAQMDDVALRVREDLDLDMAGVRDRLLENELVRPERVARLGAGGGERRRQRAGLADEAHAAAAAAGGRLDHQRKADAARLNRKRCVRLIAFVARHARDPHRGHQPFGWLRTRSAASCVRAVRFRAR